MDLASIRMISDDLESVVSFYEQVTGVPAIWPAPVFAEVRLPACTIVLIRTDLWPMLTKTASALPFSAALTHAGQGKVFVKGVRAPGSHRRARGLHGW